MIEKIKNLVSKIPSGLIPFAVVIALICICLPLVLIVSYHEPIELCDNDDKGVILNMLEEQHGNKEFVNLELVKNVVYSNYNDSIFKLSDKMETIDDIVLYTDIVNYTVIENDSVLENWSTIFEVEEKFLKEKVGQHLITFKRYN